MKDKNHFPCTSELHCTRHVACIRSLSPPLPYKFPGEALKFLAQRERGTVSFLERRTASCRMLELGFCDGRVGTDFCLLKDKIPCHDSSCQIGSPRFACSATGADVSACADTAANECAALPGCVAFALCSGPGCPAGASPWVEFYNMEATATPLGSPDWSYYFNETALGPAPAPAPQCVPGPSECKQAPTGSIFPPPGDYPPGCNHKGCTTLPTLLPQWAPTYQMNQSTLIMPCNNTGSTNPASTKGWAYVDFDWSNWKGTGAADGWAKHKPMDCEELMVKQVDLTVAASPDTKAFVYRNMIKALPWFTSVREKLTDPAYGAWFMNFSAAVVANHSAAHVPVCDDNYSPPLCSTFYHDQSQTPGYPHGDGDCAAPGKFRSASEDYAVAAAHAAALFHTAHLLPSSRPPQDAM